MQLGHKSSNLHFRVQIQNKIAQIWTVEGRGVVIIVLNKQKLSLKWDFLSFCDQDILAVFCGLIKRAGGFFGGIFPHFCCNISEIYYYGCCCCDRKASQNKNYTLSSSCKSNEEKIIWDFFQHMWGVSSQNPNSPKSTQKLTKISTKSPNFSLICCLSETFCIVVLGSWSHCILILVTTQSHQLISPVRV